MGRRKALAPDTEIERVISTLRRLGLQIGAVDIRVDGVTVHPPAPTPENDFDRWLSQDKNRDRPARRQ